MKYMMEIREKTSLLHSASEHSGFIKYLIDGKATVSGYGEYLFNLHAMYQAIEEALEANKDHEVLKEFVTPELYRSQLIQQDIDVLLKEKKSELSLLASTKASVARIRELATSKPELIIAYAYTRFLADLFGGRTFYELLGGNYNVSEEALNYYKFDQLGDMKTYVMGYHNKLANIDLSEEGKEMLLNEISNAYIYNLAISNELEAKLQPMK